ncbi:hypothetical protein [Bradyrhizobium sp. USDA 336]|uniref:hypothetical protein n=1 Tax=Bradyrhizobium sp. USDA 336 TaxID=3156311 RepID=UPI003832AF8C
MASAWNYSSFMPSLPPSKMMDNQMLGNFASDQRSPVPHAKFAICSILVRRTKVVQPLKQEAAQFCQSSPCS